MGKPDGIIILVIWQFFAALFSLAGILIMLLFFLPAVAWLYDYARTGAIWGLSIFLFFICTYFAASIAGGIGLLSGRKYGRLASLYQAAVSLILFPLGTAAGIFGLIYLNRPDTKQYFRKT
ncbi:MAG: hypothetical protein QQM50_01205 [Dehalococcoides mccartyi]|jgi:hypothetical protein|uniref:hypothetical protein n=1 Tax=Dehalococcoides TaxID=61434 RepID=UPI0004E0A344|nr:hypothetical protein [Dehalococcoides mccartyi]AII59777.1 hypothetical protein X793_05540 [Dehalococcoides mccartyi CG4]MBF4482169.1 hypothetical protein [Dehalococcoides mccartyi]MBJ7531747.1 hypothetical protein [Dehalococcoides mccartyi]MDP4279155.1 hypothetical protein [Dehalococcoides mccartyi]